MFELAIYKMPSANLELSNVVISRGRLPLSLLKMNGMLRMLSKNCKEKNFVALELILNGLKEAVDMTPVERTRKMINVSNVENEATSLAIAEDVVAVVVVVLVVDAVAEVVAEVEAEDMAAIGAALLDEEAMNEAAVEVEVVVGVVVVADLLEERPIVAVVQEAIVVLQVRAERTTSIRVMFLEKPHEKPQERVIVLVVEVAANPQLVLSQDRKAEVLAHRRKENDRSVNNPTRSPN